MRKINLFNRIKFSSENILQDQIFLEIPRECPQGTFELTNSKSACIDHASKLWAEIGELNFWVKVGFGLVS